MTCSAGVPVAKGTSGKEKHLPRTSALMAMFLWLHASGTVAKTHISGFMDRSRHVAPLRWGRTLL